MISLRQEAIISERRGIVECARLESVTAAARQFSCSRTTGYKQQKRFREGGLLALVNRPRGSREPIPEEVVALKSSALHRSSTKVRRLLEERHGIRLSRQSSWRILSARGLARVIDPTPLVRFARPWPTQLWQMDLKEKVKFPFGVAHLLVVIDAASRSCVGGRWIQDKREATLLGAVAAILEQAGLPEAILTDRETAFDGPASRQRGLTTYQLGLESVRGHRQLRQTLQALHQRQGREVHWPAGAGLRLRDPRPGPQPRRTPGRLGEVAPPACRSPLRRPPGTEGQACLDPRPGPGGRNCTRRPHRYYFHPVRKCSVLEVT